MTHQLFLTERQITKKRNVFANNISTGIKLIKVQISKIIQPGGSFGFWLANLEKKAPTNVAITLARNNLPGLASSLTSNAINKLERTKSETGAWRSGKGFTLFISNKGMNDIIKIIKSLENSGVLIDGITETVKDEIKKTRRQISWGFVSTLSCFISAASKRYKWKES